MVDWTMLSGALALFLVGIRLSAFFSGSETGFYRLSLPSLTIDAHAGDRTAERLLWWARNPSHFVATTLVGNNVANYVTTLAIGLGTVAMAQTSPGYVEIIGTVLFSPVVFVLGELIPKNLYFRAPDHFLRRDQSWFSFFYRLFLPVSLPLIGLTRLFERFSGSTDPAIELVFGRKRLVQVLKQGHQRGLLTDTQERLVNGLLQTASQPVTQSMTPAHRVLGVAETASSEEIVAFARSYGITTVAIRRANSTDRWFGTVRVADVAISEQPISKLIQDMVPLAPSCTKLEALQKLQAAGKTHGVVAERNQVLGIISRRGLIEQLIRPPQTASARTSTPAG